MFIHKFCKKFQTYVHNVKYPLLPDRNSIMQYQTASFKHESVPLFFTFAKLRIHTRINIFSKLTFITLDYKSKFRKHDYSGVKR